MEDNRFEGLLRRVYSFDAVIVTMSSLDGSCSSFDVHSGVVNCSEEDGDVSFIFEHILRKIFKSGGSLVIREFLKETFRSIGSSDLDLPKKNLYNIFILDDVWTSLDPSEVSMCQNTDSNTGELICGDYQLLLLLS